MDSRAETVVEHHPHHARTKPLSSIRGPLSSPSELENATFPMSRFPPVPLERPLEVFGKSFDIELSSGLTSGPDKVLRAADGRSIQTLLRGEEKLRPMRQLRDGLQGRQRLSSTTKASVRYGQHWVRWATRSSESFTQRPPRLRRGTARIGHSCGFPLAAAS